MSADELSAAGTVMRTDAEQFNLPHPWHPAVALAVADWLDHEAEACGLKRSPFVEEGHERAHTVARAYLGEDA